MILLGIVGLYIYILESTIKRSANYMLELIGGIVVIIIILKVFHIL